MKTPILAILTLAAIAFAPGCANQTPAQKQADAALVANLVQAVQNGAAAYYGVPPNQVQALNLAESSLWGAYVQVQNGQPVDNASVAANVNDAIAAVIPAKASNAKVLAALQAAAATVKTKTPVVTVPSAQRHLPTLYYGHLEIRGATIECPQVVYSVP